MNWKPALAPLRVALTLCLFPALAGAQEKQRTVQEVYQEAIGFYETGNYKAALQGFQTVLKYQPNFIYARSYSAKCLEKMRAGGGARPSLEAKLAPLVIPSVAFEATDLSLVFEYLRQKSEELSGGKVVANFIYKGTEEEKKSKLVTLSLRNAPFTEVVRYVTQLTDTVAEYEEFAIVVKPVGQASSPAPAQTAPGTPGEPKFDTPPVNQTPFPKTPQKDPFSKR